MMAGGGFSDHPMDQSGGPDRHIPVLLAEVLEALSPHDGGIYMDATFGAGGYTRALLDAADCKVIAIDQDPDAIAEAEPVRTEFGGRLSLKRGRFSALDLFARAEAPDGVDGVVFELGVSAMQLDRPERGFSVREEGPLDMRMGQHGKTVADLVNKLPAAVLADVLYRFGEERRSRAIAKRIAEKRADKPITTTAELATAVTSVLGHGKPGQIHPATRTFQALRIAVNRELEELLAGLLAAEKVLKPGGRLAVVSFHSLEDRIVKRFFTLRGQQSAGSRHRPERPREAATFTTLFRGAQTPSDDEMARNPRARSARLRAGIRTGAPALEAPDALKRLAAGPRGLEEALS